MSTLVARNNHQLQMSAKRIQGSVNVKTATTSMSERSEIEESKSAEIIANGQPSGDQGGIHGDLGGVEDVKDFEKSIGYIIHHVILVD